MVDLSGKVALVTGASRGIGRACALQMAELGADVVINYHSHGDEAETAVEDARRLGRRAIAVQADVADREAVDRMVEKTIEELGRIDILVANAYFSKRQPFLEIETESLERTFDVTLWGAFHAAQSVSRTMVDQGDGGAICFISSVQSFAPMPSSLGYNTAKAGMNHMSANIAMELAPHKIRVNVIQPGWIDTPGERKFMTEEDMLEAGIHLPWGRLGESEEVARTAAFLCSDAASYITGAVLRVDGGWWFREIPG